ncbi:uncharacterized protein LOC132926876 [Rhopalosiphum padi]|uniref:uncharacterized protein LOC132926876 n=1 Tax=Rhopalosiphum padi TaxID=40932 RepID=UPI00298E72E4|nr:uncharacterized protein LOC132926876 [Rhopalosiphum padi]
MCISSRRSLSFESTIDKIHNELDEEVVPLPSEILVEESSLDTLSKDELVDEKSLTTPPSRFTHFSQRERKVYFEDFKSLSDIETPKSRLKYWHASQFVILKLKKKIKRFTSYNTKFQNKIKKLSSLIEHLNED